MAKVQEDLSSLKNPPREKSKSKKKSKRRRTEQSLEGEGPCMFGEMVKFRNTGQGNLGERLRDIASSSYDAGRAIGWLNNVLSDCIHLVQRRRTTDHSRTGDCYVEQEKRRREIRYFILNQVVDKLLHRQEGDAWGVISSLTRKSVQSNCNKLY